MKAHRRNGIPTLMLAPGGSPKGLSGFLRSKLQRRELPTSPAGRMVYIPGIPGDYDKAESLIRRQFVRDLAPQLSVFFEDISDDDYETFKQAISPLAGLRSLAKNTQGRPEFRDKIASTVGNLSRLPEGFLPQFVDPLKQSLESELSRLSPRLGPPAPDFMDVQKALLESAKSSSEAAAQEAARQEQEGLAGTAATSVAPEGPEEEAAATAATPAGTQAQAQADLARTGAQRAADALSGGVLRPQTTSAPAAAAAEQPIAIEPDDSVTGNLNSILLGEASKFDERERLKQLKETFGLNLSDMERSAPALAFSFALMGATKEPGESPLQAFVRNAGAAGQSALAQQQALDAKQRSLDAALISPILTERRAAEAIERDKEWVTYWDGTTKDGLPNYKSTKMNARQIEEAQKAGINLVPLGLAGTYISQSALVKKATKEAEIKLGKAIREQAKDIAEAQRGTVRKSEGRDVREVTGTAPDGSPTTIIFNANPVGRFNSTSAGLSSTSTSMAKVDDMLKAVDQGALGAVGTLNFVIEGTKDYLFGGVGSNINETVSTLGSVGGVSGDLAWNGDNDEEAKSQLKRAMGDSYDKDLSAEQNFQKFFNEKAVFANVTDEDLNRLREEATAAKPEDRSRYQARIDYLVNQRSLAASLAPLLLGESGRTISDADRVRVIELMGGFASGLKVTRPQEALSTLQELKSILGRNAEKLVASLESEVLELETASKTPLFIGRPNDMVYKMTPPVAESLKNARDALEIYNQIFGRSGASSADQNATPTVFAGKVSEL